jgi:hypothetical protein
MSIESVKKTVRYDAQDVRDAHKFFGPRKFSWVANQALKRLLRRHRRKLEDEMLRSWLRSRSEEEKAQDRELVQQASRSSLRVLEDQER